MYQIGHLGSSLLLLPAFLVMVLILVGAGRRREAIALTTALFAVVFIIVGAKLAFYPCARTYASVESPSGHASLATVFYGSVALIVAVGHGVRVKLAIYLATIVLIVLIGLSRVETYAHTHAEVVVGFGLGLIPLAAFVGLRGRPDPVHLAPRTLVIGIPVVLVCAAAILVLARHWTPEPYIDAGARRIDALLQVCTAPQRHSANRLLVRR